MNSELGFIVRGGAEQPRRLCLWHKAFQACAECHEAAPVGTEAYLSAFTFDDAIAAHLEAHGSPRGFAGATGGAYVWLDLDGPGALDDARRLCVYLEDAGGAAGAMVFFSGSKGYHLGIPAASMGATPGADFHTAAKSFAQALVRDAGAPGTFDGSIYDRVRIFRAPNSRHAKTGLHKIALDLDSICGISEDAIKALARDPRPFEVPEAGGLNVELARRWQEAKLSAAGVDARRAVYREAVASGEARLNALTIAFIREGAGTGERASRCFQAAANLAECGAPVALVRGLLEEVALDSGLTPSEARRQIDCGAKHGGAVL